MLTGYSVCFDTKLFIEIISFSGRDIQINEMNTLDNTAQIISIKLVYV